MDETLSNVQSLMAEAVDLLRKQQERHMQGEEFNAFDVCRIGSEETRHSAIIAALLDPKGTHGLGSRSLKIFLQEAGLPEFAEYCDDCEVQTEVKIPGSTCTEWRERRLDIVISGHDLCVVIENKTTSADRPGQLADYRSWLDTQKASYKALLYLTYNGDEAADEHIAKEKYIRISYKKTLRHWLLQCEIEAISPCQKISNFFGQYADFINNKLITGGKTMNQQELDALISASPENFLAAREIYLRFETVQKEKYEQLFNEWALDTTRPVKKISRTLLPSACDQLTFESGRPDLLIAFEFANPGFRDFSCGLKWADEKYRDKDHGFPEIEGWNKAPMWPYWKYFTGDYRNPVYVPEFLITRKNQLYRILDEAYLELQELLSQLPPAE